MINKIIDEREKREWREEGHRLPSLLVGTVATAYRVSTVTATARSSLLPSLALVVQFNNTIPYHQPSSSSCFESDR